MNKIFLKSWCLSNGVPYINMWRHFDKIKKEGKNPPKGIEFVGRNVVISQTDKTIGFLKNIASGFKAYEKN